MHPQLRSAGSKSLRPPLGAIVIVAALLSTWVAPRAQATGIFWSAETTIGTANLDGTGVEQNFLTTSSIGAPVAVDGTYVYWGDGQSISRASADGTGVEQNFIVTPQYVTAIAVDDSYIYWALNDRIGRANLDGTGVISSFLFGASGTSMLSLAVNESHIYWGMIGNAQGSTSSMGRANLDGTGANLNFMPGTVAYGIAVDEAHLYVTYLSGIFRANLDGTNVDGSFITGGSQTFGVAVDGSHVYWTNSTYDGSLGRANLDGTGVNQSFITGIVDPSRIAVVPEPTTGLLVMLGLMGLAARDGEAPPAPRRSAVSSGGLKARTARTPEEIRAVR